MAHGAFTFVLHSHLPYARLAGRWPHGEEWIHEAASETYIPLLQMLYDLKEKGVKFCLTIGITPILAEQLNDPTVLDNFDSFLDMRIAAAKSDRVHFAGNLSETSQAPGTFLRSTPATKEDSSNSHLCYLAEWYKDFYEGIKQAFHKRFQRDLIAAFRSLQDEGYIEIMTSAATHAYLPLLNQDSSIRAQIATAIQSYERLFGRKPSAMWLPECAYRPAYIDENGNTRSGLETFLAEYGIKVFFSETHTITGGQAVGVAAGDVIGPYGAITRRYVIPAAHAPLPQRETSTFQAYYVSNTVEGVEANSHSGVAAIGRDNNTGQQVWSADWGYPGDFDYREFHKKAGTSGLQYWRVTSESVDLGQKDYYQPESAKYKIEQHAEHFAHLVGDLLRDYQQKKGEYGLIASSYDTELFGHWWFEGIQWLGKVLEHLANSEEIDLVSASDFITQHPPQETLHLPESSWGAGGTHFTWDNGETHWMWLPIHEAEARMEALANQFDEPSEDQAFALAQAARELLLLQSSDWPFLVTTGQAREYAIQRFTQHIERFHNLAEQLEQGQVDLIYIAQIYELDKVFPDIDYRIFCTN